MNYSLGDRQRSLRRFVMNALGSPPWKVRIARQPVENEDRPVAVVEASTPLVTLRARTSIPQGDIERQQTFGLALYPVLGETAAESWLIASEVAELLANAVGVGLSLDDGTVLSAPEMIPVYDFEGVPVTGAAATRAGADEAYGWMHVHDFPVRAIQDPEDPLRWTVTCDLRVSWSQAGRVRPPASVAGSMPGEWAGP